MSDIPYSYWFSVACALTVAVAKNNYAILAPLTMGILPRIVDSVKKIWPDFITGADNGYMAESKGEFIEGKLKDECKGKNDCKCMDDCKYKDDCEFKDDSKYKDDCEFKDDCKRKDVCKCKDDCQCKDYCKCNKVEIVGVIPREGNYLATGSWYTSLIVEGASAVIKDAYGVSYNAKIEIGNFGKSDPDIAETTGQNFYNIKLTTDNFGVDVVEHGVVSEDGANITMKGTDGIAVLEWITQEEVDALEADGDPIEAPPCPYKIQPENVGKLLWISGPPGVGKSTTAQLLSRNEGYVYYEADCFFACKNPYIPSDVPDPSVALVKQRNLIGEGLEERKKVIQKSAVQQLIAGEDYDHEVTNEFYGMMCEDIKKERKRIGGDWVISKVVPKRWMRDFIRSCLGPDLVFVLLNIEDEDLERRLSKRHKEDEPRLQLNRAIKRNCDPAGDDENAIEIMVTNDMSKEEVVNKILKMI